MSDRYKNDNIIRCPLCSCDYRPIHVAHGTMLCEGCRQVFGVTKPNPRDQSGEPVTLSALPKDVQPTQSGGPTAKEICDLRGQLEAATEALKPFAKMLDDYEQWLGFSAEGDKDCLVELDGNAETLLWRHFFDARAALATIGGKL